MYERRLIAHRGASNLAPENTLSALVRSHDMGATWVELDIQISRDGECFIFHDRSLSRTTNGRGIAHRKTWSYLSALDAGSWFSEQYRGERIPLLAEYLALAIDDGVGVNIEMKSFKGQSREVLIHRLVAVLLQYPRSWLESKVLVSSADDALLVAFHRCVSFVSTALVMDRWTRDAVRLLKQLGCRSVHINAKLLTEAVVKEIHGLGFRCFAYTVNDPIQATQLFALGVDGLFTDSLNELSTALIEMPGQSGEE